MTRPEKVMKRGIGLNHDPKDSPFATFVEVVRGGNKLEDGAVVNVSGESCITGKTHAFSWTSEPVNLRTDLVERQAGDGAYLKLKFNLVVRDTGQSCRREILPGPESVTVTITNDPGDPPNTTSDPEDVDPIYFP